MSGTEHLTLKNVPPLPPNTDITWLPMWGLSWESGPVLSPDCRGEGSNWTLQAYCYCFQGPERGLRGAGEGVGGLGKTQDLLEMLVLALA